MSSPRPAFTPSSRLYTTKRDAQAGAVAPADVRPASCRACGGGLHHPVVDLGPQPARSAPLGRDELERPEPLRPLLAFVCERCALVQLAGRPAVEAEPEPVAPGAPPLGEDDVADLVERLGARSRVVQLGSGDGAELEPFAVRGCSTLGLEGSDRLAGLARARGIPTVSRPFDAASAAQLAEQVGRADLVLVGEALGRAEDLHDVAAGVRSLLARDGVALVDLLDVARLVAGTRFDLLEHGRPSYPSLTALRRVLGAHALELAGVTVVDTGHLRVQVRHVGRGDPLPLGVQERLELEQREGLDRAGTWQAFEERARAARRRLLQLLVRARESGRTVAAWGARGALLDACGARRDLVDFAVSPDAAVQGGALPGSRVPLEAPDKVFSARPDYVLVLSADQRVEAARALAGIEAWGGRLVVATPDVDVFSPRLVLDESPRVELRIDRWRASEGRASFAAAAPEAERGAA